MCRLARMLHERRFMFQYNGKTTQTVVSGELCHERHSEQSIPIKHVYSILYLIACIFILFFVFSSGPESPSVAHGRRNIRLVFVHYYNNKKDEKGEKNKEPQIINPQDSSFGCISLLLGFRTSPHTRAAFSHYMPFPLFFHFVNRISIYAYMKSTRGRKLCMAYPLFSFLSIFLAAPLGVKRPACTRRQEKSSKRFEYILAHSQPEASYSILLPSPLPCLYVWWWSSSGGGQRRPGRGMAT